jgi:hypothetical protein
MSVDVCMLNLDKKEIIPLQITSSDRIKSVATKKPKFLKKMSPPSHLSALLTSISIRALIDAAPLAIIGIFFAGNHEKNWQKKLNDIVPNGNFKDYTQKTLLAGAVYNIFGKASIHYTQDIDYYPLKGMINFITPAVMTGIVTSAVMGSNMKKDVNRNIQAFLGSNIGRITSNHLCNNDAIGNTVFAALLAAPISCYPNFDPKTLISTFTRRLAIRTNGNFGATIAQSLDNLVGINPKKTSEEQQLDNETEDLDFFEKNKEEKQLDNKSENLDLLQKNTEENDFKI